MSSPSSIGHKGELHAYKYLLRHSHYQVLERNWKYKNRYEIDIIASSDRSLIAFEVKTHHHQQATAPFDAITDKKIALIKHGLQLYARISGYDTETHLQIDVISITLHPLDLQHFVAVA